MPVRAAMLCAAVALLASACTKDSPTTPTPTGPRLWTLSGTVRRADTNAPIADAQVEIVSGTGAGRTATTSSAGAYAFLDVPEGEASVRVRHADYLETSRSVGLMASSTLDFALTWRPRANVQAEGTVTFTPLPPNYTAWDARGVGRNFGDACASDVTGTIVLLGANEAEMDGTRREFNVPGVIRPGGELRFTACCYTTDAVNASRFYGVVFRWTDTSC
jgi:hypothetical protein